MSDNQNLSKPQCTKQELADYEARLEARLKEEMDFAIFNRFWLFCDLLGVLPKPSVDVQRQLIDDASSSSKKSK
jgi:hypothetical protein